MLPKDADWQNDTTGCACYGVLTEQRTTPQVTDKNLRDKCTTTHVHRKDVLGFFGTEAQRKMMWCKYRRYGTRCGRTRQERSRDTVR